MGIFYNGRRGLPPWAGYSEKSPAGDGKEAGGLTLFGLGKNLAAAAPVGNQVVVPVFLDT